ncbi:undecaprenyl-diphosphatase [Cytobacillus purgationiresistens]|uniref:Undecaprenyl-diphosphatase n=1 Tax=Cytobacillus purgationiresistens TaxID=863449 RepID=A0ABU0AAZ1_9BACI|nr:undecaprenyl-diphosphatase [Cytobacillus purgationiresistens]MDQ0268420.1 undecaprenyl-diphosphatase [Cytobacillus purgationiresistens]
MNEVNISLFRAINDLGFEYPSLNSLFIFIAEYTVYALALLTLIYWFTRKEKNRYMILTAGFAFILAEILGKLAGKLHFNYQPFVELSNVNLLIDKAANNSFPSDHTILFFSFCVAFWLFNKKNFAWLILAILVGISRVWVGVHYPFDVLVGALLAALSAVFMYYLLPRLPIVQNLLGVYERIEEKILPAKKERNKEFDQ